MGGNSQGEAMSKHTLGCECRNCTHRRHDELAKAHKMTLSMLERVVDAAYLALREDSDGAKAELARICDQAEILIK